MKQVFMTQINVIHNSFSEHLISLWHWFHKHIIQACIRIGIWETILIWPLIACLSIQYFNNMYLLYKLLQHIFMFIDFEDESYMNGRGRLFSDCLVVELNYPCNQCLSPLTLWVWIPSRRGVLETTLCDKVCQGLATGRWFSQGTPDSSTNKTDCYDITKILLKVAFNPITITLTPYCIGSRITIIYEWHSCDTAII
jgi:hypothetical protein